MADETVDAKALASVLYKARMRLDEAIKSIEGPVGDSPDLGSLREAMEDINTSCPITNTGCHRPEAEVLAS